MGGDCGVAETKVDDGFRYERLDRKRTTNEGEMRKRGWRATVSQQLIRRSAPTEFHGKVKVLRRGHGCEVMQKGKKRW